MVHGASYSKGEHKVVDVISQILNAIKLLN